MADKKKFKSKLRDKFKKAKERDKSGGRSLGYGDRTAENYYGDYKEVTLPESQRKQFNTRLKEAMQNRAKEVLSEGTRTGLNTAKDSAREVHRGLTGIRHPAQLIPAIKGASTLAGIIKALTKK